MRASESDTWLAKMRGLKVLQINTIQFSKGDNSNFSLVINVMMYYYIVALCKCVFHLELFLKKAMLHMGLFLYKEILSIYHTVGRCFILDYVENEHCAMDPGQ